MQNHVPAVCMLFHVLVLKLLNIREIQLNKQELNMSNLPNIPYNLTEQQTRDVVAFLWINKPDEIYEGLKQAFNLAPKEGERVQ